MKKKAGNKQELNFQKLRGTAVQLLLLVFVLTGCIHKRSNQEDNNPPKIRTLDTKIPIVLIHGMNSSSGAWGTAESFLKANGYKVDSDYYKFDYSKTTGEDIQNNADRLRSWLKEKNLDKIPIALVGHSMGGLVARRAVVDDPTLNVVKLVTLASPNDGAKWAWACPPLVICDDGIRDMLPGSGFIKNLNYYSIPFNNTLNVMSYAIQGDGLVSIASSHIPNTLQKTIAEDAPSYSSKTKVTNSARGGMSKVHTSIIEKKKVLEDVLKFTQNKEKDPLMVKGGPNLRHAECYWGSANGKVQWVLPNAAPDNLMMEIMEKDKIIKTAPAKNEIIDKLSDGYYSARFYDPRTNERSEFSAFYMDKSGFKCSSNYVNNKKIINTWPNLDIKVSFDYSYLEHKIYVSIPFEIGKGSFTIKIKRDNYYNLAEVDFNSLLTKFLNKEASLEGGIFKFSLEDKHPVYPNKNITYTAVLSEWNGDEIREVGNMIIKL